MKALLLVPYVRLVLAVVMSAMFLASIRLMIGELRKRHGGAVNTLFHFFSLAVYVTLLVAGWGVHRGAFTPDGKAANAVGTLLMGLMTAVFDLDDEFGATLAIASAVIVPQWVCYALSGWFGCASRPAFVEASIKFVGWTVAKGLVVCGGVTLVLLPFGLALGWDAKDPLFGMRAALFGLMLLAVGFFVAWTMYAAEEMAGMLVRHLPASVEARLARWHRAATRHRAPALPPLPE